MTQEIAIDCLKKLKSLSIELDLEHISKWVLDNDRFKTWTGSSRPNLHHYGDFGLITHTYEVVNTALTIRELYPQYKDIDKKELFLATLFHDIGKIYDYEKVNGVWQSATHKKMIYHISRSSIMWNQAVDYCLNFPEIDEEDLVNYRDLVTHAILAHHGQREWGSPVSPKTRVAWITHQADYISARLYDTHTLENFNKEK